MSEAERAGVNWVQVIAAALAAMSSAVLLSTLGVAGTIVGAAVGSVTASIGGALYGRGIHVSRQQVASQAAALRRVGKARRDVDEAVAAMRSGEAGSDTTLRRADEALDEAEHALKAAEERAHPEAAERGPGGGVRDDVPHQDVDPRNERKLPWKRIAIIAVGVFAAAMVAITAFELATGRALSAHTGGTDADKETTVPGLGRGGDRPPAEDPQNQPDEVPTDPADEPAERTEAPVEPEESEEPVESPSEDPVEPTTLPTELPTPAPTETAPEASEGGPPFG